MTTQLRTTPNIEVLDQKPTFNFLKNTGFGQQNTVKQDPLGAPPHPLFGTASQFSSGTKIHFTLGSDTSKTPSFLLQGQPPFGTKNLFDTHPEIINAKETYEKNMLKLKTDYKAIKAEYRKRRDTDVDKWRDIVLQNCLHMRSFKN